MNGADAEVLNAAMRWLRAGVNVALVHVAGTFGSSPRPPGSLMAVSSGGDWVGSVSGGCVESRLAAELKEHWPTQLAQQRIGVTREDAQRAGLPCGGSLDLVIEPLPGVAAVKPLLDAIRARRPVARRLCLATGEASVHPATSGQDFSFDDANLVKVYGPQWRLVLIGAGQLAREVALIAQRLDYDIAVCDPREDYARQWSVAGSALRTDMPDDSVAALATDARCAVLALTHDPALDDLALARALETPAFYIGALGSQTNADKRIERLARQGVTPDALARLHAPVGLPLGGKTPAEIAVAIVAGLTAARHHVTFAIA